MSTPLSILQRYWGYSSFRPGQEEIIASILEGNDTLAILPTGGGKSICYQVPALWKPGLFLVVSPLIALMRDQVEQLRKRGITAYAIHAGMSRNDVINILTVATESNCKLLYVSPERLGTSLFQEYLPKLNIQGLAIDEAHCISQWGYDFRPAYLRIAELRPKLPDVPILALTASATPAIQEDVCRLLARSESETSKWKRFRNSFARPNLSYSVLKVPARMPRLRQILEKLSGSGILYGRSRKGVEAAAGEIAGWGQSVAYYHAGLPLDQRRERESDWMQGKTRLMVCTNAFGMGIDKPDVRFVVHLDAPDSLENYYQEAGRAGRDGKISYATLLIEPGSIQEMEERSQAQFPSIEEVRRIYQSIANYLQMPLGTGEGEWYEFDVVDFRRKFKHNSYSIKQAFALLEENQWLSYHEEVFIPTLVHVLAGRSELEQFESDQPDRMDLLKALLRQYGGIRDRPVGISELTLAKILRKDKDEVIQELHLLHREGLINHQPKKDGAQVHWLQPRASAKEIELNTDRYQHRKQEAEKRLSGMLNFLQDDSNCRSRWIGKYFGDEELMDCGICDTCLERKKRSKRIDPTSLQADLINRLKSESLDWKDLQAAYAAVAAATLKESVDYLIGEGKLRVDELGRFQSI